MNNSWNGCSEVASSTKNTTLLLSFSRELPRNSTLVIIGPSLPYSMTDGAIIRNYLDSNGTVLLADDFGSGNSLLEELNVSARFAGKPLADLYAYSKNPSFPLVSGFSHSPLSDNVSVVILDHPSFLDIRDSRQVTILASSSPFSFIDVQGNGKPAQNESVNSYPVIAYAHVGAGSLVLIADASMFINEMIGLYDNTRLFANVVKAGGSSLVFDIAHLANAPLTGMRLMMKNSLDGLIRFAQASIYLQVLIVVLVVAVSLPFQLVRQAKRRKVTVTFYT
ncbi:MAG: DUF4350 domain-containing protein [Candidatus Bathyarchaeia archaeon]